MEPSPMSQNRSGSEVDARYLQDGYWKHGRFYGSWKQGKYLFPIDSEELNRLDIFHKVFLVACQNKPFHVPVSRQAPRIMDLGTGTGIWAIHVAEEYFQGGDIMMVDLNQIQPPLIPRGVVPQQFDLEDPDWSPLWTGCDFIHMRMMLGSVQNDIWSHIYRKIFEHLAPGTGYLEHVEVDWTPRWSDETRPSDSSFVKWAELFYSGMDHFNRSARVRPQETRQMIEAAGFTDFKEEVIPAYVNPWSSDRRVRELARWFNLGLSHSVEALGLMPLVEKHGMPYEAVQELCQKVKKEICVLRFHTYCNIHIWTARKPGPPQ